MAMQRASVPNERGNAVVDAGREDVSSKRENGESGDAKSEAWERQSVSETSVP